MREHFRPTGNPVADPRVAALHDRGLATTLNVHPAEGVHAHEERYAAIARRMGVDPDSELPVDFDPADPAFLQAYLEELHHPREAEGVDFWWLDWQQGGVTRIPGLDPLWLLNHFHFLDSGRDGKRPLTFSRYAGVGSHRYPIGFSGDTVITWASLDFQPYFTATASNVGYGWWSHDVGGHFFGYKDDELTVRWTQFGVFSPITRLHSSDSPFNTREPWRFGERAQRIMTAFLALRHRLVPYLHTMNRRAHRDGEPLVQPMYYDHPDDRRRLPGAQPVLLRRPAARRPDHDARRTGRRAWAPCARGCRRAVDRRVHRPGLPRRDDDPAAPRPRHDPRARPGGRDPAAGGRSQFGIEHPDALELRVYAGADGEFTLAEEHDDERWAFTRFTLRGDELRIHPVDGERGSVPATRRYDVVLCGFTDVAGVEVDGPGGRSRPGAGSVSGRCEVVAGEGAVLRLVGDTTPAGNRDVGERVFALLDAAQIELATKEAVHRVVTEHDPARAASARAVTDGAGATPSSLRALVRAALGALPDPARALAEALAAAGRALAPAEIAALAPLEAQCHVLDTGLAPPRRGRTRVPARAARRGRSGRPARSRGDLSRRRARRRGRRRTGRG